jgi:tRNA pseudouridine13 synthase
LKDLEGDGVRLLRVSRHGNKLRPGHLRGNSFRVLVREVHPDADQRLKPIIDHLRKNGLANFYGPQRFGIEGETAQLGMSMLRGETAPGRSPSKFLRRLALSAVQAALYNAYLTERLQDGLMRQVLAGDVMAKWPAGGLFVTRDPGAEQSRFETREIVHTGPIFGRKTFAPADEASTRENEILAACGVNPSALRAFGKLLQGTRRHNLAYVDDLAVSIESSGVRLCFSLPAGSYATVLLAEVMKEKAGADDQES